LLTSIDIEAALAGIQFAFLTAVFGITPGFARLLKEAGVLISCKIRVSRGLFVSSWFFQALCLNPDTKH
jgi:hypothetical protein